MGNRLAELVRGDWKKPEPGPWVHPADLVTSFSGGRVSFHLPAQTAKNDTGSAVVIAALALSVGLVFGAVLSATAPPPAAPASEAVKLDGAAQDDYIVTIAEAYAGDHDLHLAVDRLKRLGTGDIAARVELLALDYVIQHDVIASDLAHLAIALGSTNPVLTPLNTFPTHRTLVLGQDDPSSAPVLYTELGSTTSYSGEDMPDFRTILNASSAKLEVLSSSQLNAPASPESLIQPLELIQAAAWDDPFALEKPTRASARNRTDSSARPPGAAAPSAPPAPAPKPKLASVAPVAPVKKISSLTVTLPDFAGEPAVSITVIARPPVCTPAPQMPAVVDHTIALCPGQEYQPFRVEGDTITVYGDREGTSFVRGIPRGYGIAVSGNNIAIIGVHVQGATHPDDLNTWLCLYDACSSSDHGAAGYGGGILLDHTTNAAVVSSSVSGGTIGILSYGSSNSKIVSNTLSQLNGWGVLLFFSNHDYVVADMFRNINRACLIATGEYLQSGCESSGLSAIAVHSSVIVSNYCEHTANCYYASGVAGYGSFDNKFVNNYCSDAGNNCFEVTFSTGNQFDYNTATGPCDYPFWIGGSVVKFGAHNFWSCRHTAEQALRDSQHNVSEVTDIQQY